MDRACSKKRRNAYRISIRKPEGKRPIGRHEHKWEDNNKMDLKQIWRAVWTAFNWLSVGSVMS
jgi:hypothetical protein